MLRRDVYLRVGRLSWKHLDSTGAVATYGTAPGETRCAGVEGGLVGRLERVHVVLADCEAQKLPSGTPGYPLPEVGL